MGRSRQSPEPSAQCPVPRASLPRFRISRSHQSKPPFPTQPPVCSCRPLQTSHCYCLYSCGSSDHDSRPCVRTCFVVFVISHQSCLGEVFKLVRIVFLAPAIPSTGASPLPQFPRIRPLTSRSARRCLFDLAPSQVRIMSCNTRTQLASLIAMLLAQYGGSLAVSSSACVCQPLLLHLTHLACMDWRLISFFLPLPCVPLPFASSLWQPSTPSHDQPLHCHLLPSRRLNSAHSLTYITIVNPSDLLSHPVGTPGDHPMSPSGTSLEEDDSCWVVALSASSVEHICTFPRLFSRPRREQLSPRSLRVLYYHPNLTTPPTALSHLSCLCFALTGTPAE